MPRTHAREGVTSPGSALHRFARPSPRHLSPLLAAVLLASACAPPSVMETEGVLHSRSASVAVSSRRLITATELAPVAGQRNLFDVVQRLRPELVQPRGISVRGAPAAYATVYLDGQRLGDIGVLHSISAAGVVAVEYITPGEARSRFFGPHDGGALLVRTRR